MTLILQGKGRLAARLKRDGMGVKPLPSFFNKKKTKKGR